MKKVLSVLLASIMLLSIGVGIPVNAAAASLPKSAVTSIAAYPCGFTADFKKQKNITGYQMQYSTSKKFNKKSAKAVKTTKAYYAVRKLGSSKRYYVRVRTYKKSGKKYTYSAWSSAKSVTTLNKNCPDPAQIKSLKGEDKKFTVAVSKSANAGGYQIRYSTKSNLSNAKMVTVNGKNNTTLTVTGCAAGTKYYVQSRAFKKVNGKTYYSNWSAAKNVTTNKTSATKPATTTKKMLSKEDVEWVQAEANAYIKERGIGYDESVGGYSFATSTYQYTDRDELLKDIKGTIDWQYQECIDTGSVKVWMYVKIEARSNGSYFIYVMYR